jgi:hypothetical protein
MPSSIARGDPVVGRLPSPMPRRHRRGTASATPRFAAPTRRLSLDADASVRCLFAQVSVPIHSQRRHHASEARDGGRCPHEDHDAQDGGGSRALAKSDGRVADPRGLRGHLRRQLAARRPPRHRPRPAPTRPVDQDQPVAGYPSAASVLLRRARPAEERGAASAEADQGGEEPAPHPPQPLAGDAAPGPG